MAELVDAFIPTVIWKVDDDGNVNIADPGSNYVAEAQPVQGEDKAATADENTNTPFHWSEDITKKFILLRHEKRNYFCGKRSLTQKAWMEILEELGVDKQLTIAQARKKWGNLVLKYKQLKGLPTQCNSPLPGRDTAETWPYFDVMDEVMGRPPSVIKPMSVVASARLPEDKAVKEVCDASEIAITPNSENILSAGNNVEKNTTNSLLVFESADGSMGELPYQTFQIMLEDGDEVDATALRELLEKHAEAALVAGTGENTLTQDTSINVEEAQDLGSVIKSSSSGLPCDVQDLLNAPQQLSCDETNASVKGQNQNTKSSIKAESHKLQKRLQSKTEKRKDNLPPVKRPKLMQEAQQKPTKRPSEKQKARSQFLTWLQDSMQRSNERQATFESQGHRLNQLFDELVELVRVQQRRELHNDESDEEDDNDQECTARNEQLMLQIS